MNFTSMYDPPNDLCDEEQILQLQLVLYHWGLPGDVIQKMGILKLPWRFTIRWKIENTPETGTEWKLLGLYYY